MEGLEVVDTEVVELEELVILLLYLLHKVEMVVTVDLVQVELVVEAVQGVLVKTEVRITEVELQVVMVYLLRYQDHL